MNTGRRFISLLVCLILVSAPSLLAAQKGPISRPIPPRTDGADDLKKGLQFRISEGVEQRARPAEPPAANAAPLGDAQSQALLSRLPLIKAESDDEKEFALRDRSLPPPRTGKTITESFPQPPASSPETNSRGPLEVLRHAPEGEVPIAPHLSVTFSQPMVAVTSQMDAAQTVPIKLSPEPPGKWRWIGTSTILFEPQGRFPMATSYSVQIPAGTRSATGGSLGGAVSWKFTTPAPKVIKKYPEGGSISRAPIMFMEFDQRIDSDTVLKNIRVTAGATNFRLRSATQDEIDRDDSVSQLAKNAQPGRWIALRAVGNGDPKLVLPAGSTVQVTLASGTPSAEGPLKTSAPQTFTFETFGPLRVVEARCGWDKTCSPFDSWSITFTNPLDATAFDKSQVRVEPDIPGLKIALFGNTLSMSGVKRGRTTYRVILDQSIRDQFGQTLGASSPIVFNVGSAPPTLGSSGKVMVVLDPSGPARFSVFSVNHRSLRVRLFAVGPEDWGAFMSYFDGRDGGAKIPPGRVIVSDTIPVKGEPDEMAETRIDLTPALHNGLGQVIVLVEPGTILNRRDRQSVAAWVQATQIGLDAFSDSGQLVGWATSLKDGKPVEGARLAIEAVTPGRVNEQSSNTTDRTGLVRLQLGGFIEGAANILVARKGPDLAILPENTYWWSRGSSWYKGEPKDSLRWFVFDDRKMYRPGEEVHIKGWIRRIGAGPSGDVEALGGSAATVDYVLKDSRGNEVLKGSLRINAMGGFDTSFKLPPTMNLGYGSLTLDASGSAGLLGNQYNHQIQVQEFRRPEFEVNASASEGEHMVGGSATVTVAANYYAGGALPNAETNWTVTATPTNYTPPNRSSFTFGTWAPWWFVRPAAEERLVRTLNGKTDALGKHTIHLDFDSVNPPRPSVVTAQASVSDVNRQQWSASAGLLVHPASLYVGLKSPRTFVQKGEPLIVQSIATDIDGNAVRGRAIKLKLVLLDWVFEKGEWRQKETNPQECSKTSGTDAVECRFEPKEGGTYRVTATVLDDRERANESTLTLWVAGGKVPPKRDVEQEEVNLIPDRKDYEPGSTAEILVQAPFYPAEGVMTLRRSGLVSTEHFRMEGSSHTLRIPISERYLPNVHVQVDLVGAAARTNDSGQTDDRLPKRPAFATGNLNLDVSPLSRKLSVKATPRDAKLEPGGETTVDVEVRDAEGRPVSGSELAIVVVDEAVLSLTGYKVGDPLSTFYSQRGADVTDFHLRHDIVLPRPEDINGTLGGVPGGVASGAAGGALKSGDMLRRMAPAEVPSLARMANEPPPPSDAIQLRENFNALAVFAAAVPTDGQGHAQVKVKLPDNLTRYRVMAVAVAGGKQFGENESAITARLPLMARPSAPRFLNFGDKFELPVVIQNQTDSPMDVDVAVRASNAELTEGAGRRVTVPANDRVEVRFPTAASRAGTARFQIAAASGKWSDAAEIQLPVWTPATTEAFATYGEIDDGAIIQPIKAPSDSVKQFGGLEVSTSSTELQALTDAVLYLVSYPFECSEQISSRVLAIAALRDVLTAFHAKGLPEPEALIAAVKRDIKRLETLQNNDGGFAFWRKGDESWPYLSIHVAHALVRAKEKQFDVPGKILDSSKHYLREIESHIPNYYGPEARRALIAYALYVRNRMGDRDTARARRLIGEAGLDNLSLESTGWLLSVLSGDQRSTTEVVAIRKHLANRAEETAGTAHFTSSYKDGDYLLLSSSRRADGVILEALIGDQPESDLIPKIVRGLLAHRSRLCSCWQNTQENAFILLALDRYFAKYEKATPNFVARAWLGQSYAGEQQFKGRTTDRHEINVPMRYLADGPAQQNLVLSKDGPGRLYYRVGLRYAPASLKLAAAEYGFTVQRSYEAVDKADDVRRDSDGAWHIKAGASVRVRLTMVAPTRRYYVALVDPIPAGLEALNPALAVTGPIPQDPKEETVRGNWWWWSRPWFEHQNMRDERVEAFASLLWEGVYNYSYVARATTPGTFVVPPAKAEEMYQPENFGRSSTDRVIVE